MVVLSLLSAAIVVHRECVVVVVVVDVEMIIVRNEDDARSAAKYCDSFVTSLVTFPYPSPWAPKTLHRPPSPLNTIFGRHGTGNTRSRLICSICEQKETDCYYHNWDGRSRKVHFRAEDKFVSPFARSAIAAIRPQSGSCCIKHTIRAQHRHSRHSRLPQSHEGVCVYRPHLPTSRWLLTGSLARYNLGPNGGILTALNLFTTKFDQVLDIVEKRADTVE